MNKQELAEYLEKEKARFVNVYGGEIVTHAPKAPVAYQRKQLAKQMTTGIVVPEDQRKAEWEKYIDSLL